MKEEEGNMRPELQAFASDRALGWNHFVRGVTIVTLAAGGLLVVMLFYYMVLRPPG